jgi:hypothetical protein
MKTIEAYETPDGTIFTDEDRATDHYADLLGEELDGLLKIAVDNVQTNMTRNDQYRVISTILQHPEKFRAAINILYNYVNFYDDRSQTLTEVSKIYQRKV